MTVLVTGGLGFIGVKVVLQLLKRDIPVIVADLDIEKNKGKLEKNIKRIGFLEKGSGVKFYDREKKKINLSKTGYSHF